MRKEIIKEAKMKIKRDECGTAVELKAKSLDELRTRLERFLGMGLMSLPDGSHFRLTAQSPTGIALVAIDVYRNSRDEWSIGGVAHTMTGEHWDDLIAIDEGRYNFEKRQAEPKFLPYVWRRAAMMREF